MSRDKISFASSFVNTDGILVFHLIYEFFNQPVNIKDSRLRKPHKQSPKETQCDNEWKWHKKYREKR